MVTNKLKPCPFCGGEAVVMDDYDLFRCGCNDQECIAWVADMPKYLTRSGAVNDWNTRAYEGESTLLAKVKSLIASLEREADSAGVAYVHYGGAEDRAEYCSYKDAARRLAKVIDENIG